MAGDGWCSYDAVAERYAAVAERLYFARPARDLVARLEVARGSRLLDVGTGTGAVAAAAADLVGPDGLVVGVDPAIGMLQHGRVPGGFRPVAGGLPHLCFRDRSFDAVTAAFVLTHVPDYATALGAMIGVLRPGGRVGITAWARSPSSTPPGEVWQRVVTEFINDDTLRAAMRRALPWDADFANPAFLHDALAAAGLTRIHLHDARYAVRMPTRVFIDSRLVSLPSRFMETTLGQERWRSFVETASRRVTDACGGAVDIEVAVNIAIATR